MLCIVTVMLDAFDLRNSSAMHALCASSNCHFLTACTSHFWLCCGLSCPRGSFLAMLPFPLSSLQLKLNHALVSFKPPGAPRCVCGETSKAIPVPKLTSSQFHVSSFLKSQILCDRLSYFLPISPKRSMSSMPQWYCICLPSA